jgi:hypothetical protein
MNHLCLHEIWTILWTVKTELNDNWQRLKSTILKPIIFVLFFCVFVINLMTSLLAQKT